MQRACAFHVQVLSVRAGARLAGRGDVTTSSYELQCWQVANISMDRYITTLVNGRLVLASGTMHSITVSGLPQSCAGWWW